MNIAFCYESVLPARGGCETYIADLAGRLVADRHEVHLYACRWDAAALPANVHYHCLPAARGPRFLRPWRFGTACARALRGAQHDVSVGFDKTWGEDVLYPQGGLHAASAEYNLNKYAGKFARTLARAAKSLDLAHWSFTALERRQYLGPYKPIIVVNSNMVRDHFARFYAVSPAELRVVRSAIDPARFVEQDRLRRRLEWRTRWGLKPNDVAGLFVAMNYRLKGLEPLLHAIRHVPVTAPFRLLIAGHPNTASYERLAQRLGIADRVLFLGPRRDVHHCYFAADFLVHPTFYDPCSLVVLEALACGLPVITSRFNGAAELLTPPREGFVIDNPHEHQQLADCMIQLLDSSRRTACARAARQTAALWTFEHHYQQLLNVFAEAVERKRAA
jgi:UDP-glucose:(heptosyl)LPS alpha-1,3-glucosyltransferase